MMGRSVEEWEKERAKPGAARHEHIIPPEDVGGLRTRTGRLLEHEFGDVESTTAPGNTAHNKLVAVLDSLEAYTRTRLSYNNSSPLPDEEFYNGLDAHVSALGDAVKDAQKQSRADAREEQKAQDAAPREEAVQGGKRTVESGSGQQSKG